MSAELQDRAARAAASLMDEITKGSAAPDPEAVGLVSRALALGWMHGYQAGETDGIELAGAKMQEILESVRS